MPAERNRPKRENFNTSARLPFQLRPEDFEIAMQDVYDLFFDVNTGLLEKGLQRLDDFLPGHHVWAYFRPADGEFVEAFACVDAEQLLQRSSRPSRERRLPE